jgi:hypothetical protein
MAFTNCEWHSQIVNGIHKIRIVNGTARPPI